MPSEMRDGAVLIADVYPPTDGTSGPGPAVLARSPYGRASHMHEAARLNEAGYWVVIQDVRGRGDSDGTFVSYFNEGDDGYDTVEWVAGQEWCDGNVGMMGASYRGWVQWAAARERPPHLRTFVSTACCASWTGEWPWNNGVLFPGAIQWVHMTTGRVNQSPGAYPGQKPSNDWTPLSAAQERWGRHVEQAEQWLRHPVSDDYWKPIAFGPADYAAIDIPVLHLTGWFDGCQRGSHMLFEGMRAYSPAADRQALLVGAWDHTIQLNRQEYDGVDFGSDATIDFFGEHVRWFDRWLKGRDDDSQPTTRVFRTGVNRWLEDDDFPPPESISTEWFLRSDGDATGVGGRLEEKPADADEPVDRWTYDPADPVLTSDGTTSYPKLDRTDVVARPDVAVFRSEPLESAVAISGRPWAEIFAAADVPDTDWFVEIFDEDPSGRPIWVSHGRMRARFRSGFGTEDFMQAGMVHGFRFELTPRAHEFLVGHRVGVVVTNSGAPLWAPNPNGDGDIYSQTGTRVANIALHHTPAFRSHVSLPIVPAVSGG